MRKLRRIKKFLLDVRSELKKVTWTNKKELIDSTWLVIIVTVIIAIFLGIVDRLIQGSVVSGKYSILNIMK